MERIEIGDSVHAENDGLAVDDELLMSVLQCRLDDPRIALRPIVAAARDQPHAIAVALDANAAAVILDLVNPFHSLWYFSAAGGKTKFKRIKLRPQIAAVRQIATRRR